MFIYLLVGLSDNNILLKHNRLNFNHEQSCILYIVLGLYQDSMACCWLWCSHFKHPRSLIYTTVHHATSFLGSLYCKTILHYKCVKWKCYLIKQLVFRKERVGIYYYSSYIVLLSSSLKIVVIAEFSILYHSITMKLNQMVVLIIFLMLKLKLWWWSRRDLDFSSNCVLSNYLHFVILHFSMV